MTQHISCTCPACCPQKWEMNAAIYQNRRSKMTQEERDTEDTVFDTARQSGLNENNIDSIQNSQCNIGSLEWDDILHIFRRRDDKLF